MIKPIETRYNGHRFRSRLEARWAVFFDTLGIPYEYEKEGYELGDGLRYLPDFWLPKHNMWVEIKGDLIFPLWDIPDKDLGNDWQKLLKFTAQAKRIVAVCVGDISPAAFGFITVPWANNNGLEPTVYFFGAWLECMVCNHVNYGFCADNDQPYECRNCGGATETEEMHTLFHFCYFQDKALRYCPARFRSELLDFTVKATKPLLEAVLSPRVKAAFTAAREARFEFDDKSKLFPT